MNPGKFIIHSDAGDIIVRNNKQGMPYLNLKELEGKVALCLIQDAVRTVRGQMEGFTKREVEEAKAAREDAWTPDRPGVHRNGTFEHDRQL
jgi:hypothetical protein